MSKEKKSIISLGLMSGTSVDGIDATLLYSEEKKDHVLLHTQFSYPKKLRQDILAVIRSQSIELSQLSKLHYEIGHAFAAAASENIKAALRKKLVSLKKPIHSIGAHGQTIFHNPEAKHTMQIGEGSIIAARTGITTVSDFRMADTALGGEGAPLLPYYHRRLFESELKNGIVIHNLGGISNFTYINKKEIFALDTGPANCLLDGAIQSATRGKKQFDPSGNLARSGTKNEALLRFLKNAPGVKEFCKKSAPKSTGRELFSPKLLELANKKFSSLPLPDLLHTLSHFTVDLIVDAYRREIGKQPLGKIVFAGGGARNAFVLELLEIKFGREIDFLTMEDFGWNSQALESQAFGYFSYMALQGIPITFPTTTGVKGNVICGKISPGRNWNRK